jgi:glycerol-1-phosphate dehydrogenase [NAD(P)+]
MSEISKLSAREALQSARETRALEIGSNILGNTAFVFQKQFGARSAVLVTDAITLDVAGNAVSDSFHRAGSSCLEPFVYRDPNLYAEHDYVIELENALKIHDAIPVAVGSGTINDLTKLAAHRANRPYMCVATAASMDGYTAFGASITFNGSKQTFNCPAPTAVLADIEIIRKAPPEMTASGYADLLAKITAGADWIVADALGVEAIDPQAWKIVQGGLRYSLGDPKGAREGNTEAIEKLTEGLMLGGFAMQWSKSSRPASGAEHQFSHLWDMQHHTHNGAAPSHGFKVGVATLAVANFYEFLFTQPLENLDVEKCCAAWPSKPDVTCAIQKMFPEKEIADKSIEETLAKYISREKLREQLQHLRAIWPDLKTRLRNHLLPAATMKQMLQNVGAPTESEQIGISRDRLRASYRQAYHLRRRFTVLDLAVRTNLLDAGLKTIFSK